MVRTFLNDRRSVTVHPATSNACSCPSRVPDVRAQPPVMKRSLVGGVFPFGQAGSESADRSLSENPSPRHPKTSRAVFEEIGGRKRQET